MKQQLIQLLNEMKIDYKNKQTMVTVGQITIIGIKLKIGGFEVLQMIESL